MKLFIHHDRLIAIFGTGVLTLAFYFGIYQTSQTGAKKARDEIRKLEGEVAAFPVRVAERQMMRKDYENRREQIRRQAELLPEQSDVADVLQSLAELAKKSQLAILRLEPKPHIDHASYTIQPFELGLKGDFVSIGSFVSGLEKQSRLVTFEEVSITQSPGTSKKDRSDEGSVQVSLGLNVYSRRVNSSRSTENTTSPKG